MVTVMPSDENDPVHGYSTRLNSRNLDHKAMLLCTDKPGDNSWKWYGLEDTVPGMDHKMNQHQDFREMGILNVVEGAWVYEHRFAWKEAEKKEPVLLINGMLAAVYFDKDIVIFGDKLFADPWRSNPSPKALKSSGISVGDAIGKHSSHLSVVMVHELAHWFGGRDNYGKVNIDDHTAVTKAGKLLYDNNGVTEEHKTPPTGDNYRRLKTCEYPPSLFPRGVAVTNLILLQMVENSSGIWHVLTERTPTTVVQQRRSPTPTHTPSSPS